MATTSTLTPRTWNFFIVNLLCDRSPRAVGNSSWLMCRFPPEISLDAPRARNPHSQDGSRLPGRVGFTRARLIASPARSEPDAPPATTATRCNDPSPPTFSRRCGVATPRRPTGKRPVGAKFGMHQEFSRNIENGAIDVFVSGDETKLDDINWDLVVFPHGRVATDLPMNESNWSRASCR